MAKLPEKQLLNGEKIPRTRTVEMKNALGDLRDYLNDLLGNDSADKEAARQALGIDLMEWAGKIDAKADPQAIEDAVQTKADRTELEARAEELEEAIAKRGTPVGSIEYFAMEVAPAGYLKADGAAVGRTTYPDLFAAIGTTFGTGDGETTFNLPDLRGEFVRGFDDGRNVDSGRLFGQAQGDAIRNITGTLLDVYGGWNFAATGAFDETTSTATLIGSQYEGNYGKVFLDASRVVPTADENRPRNIALLACIKAFDTATNPGLIDVAGLAQEAANKADRDGSNMVDSLSSSATRYFTGLGMPDYSAGTVIETTTEEQEFVCPSCGMVNINVAGFNGEVCYLKINGQIMFSQTTNSNQYVAPATGMYPVSKGDICKFKDGYTGTFASTISFAFYPLKGVSGENHA